jgi:single-strand DNA-binding protein
VYEVEVDEVGPSLRNASAKVNRAARSNGNGTAHGGQGGQGGGRPAGDQGAQGVQVGSGADADPWAADGGGYSDEPPF